MSLANMVRRMGEAGATAEAIAIALEEIEALESALDARRAADRDRKRAQRERQKTTNVTGHSGDIPGTVTPMSAQKKSAPRPPEKKPAPLNGSPRGEPIPPSLKPEHVLEAWDTVAERYGLPKCRKLTEARQRQLRLFVKRNTIDEVRAGLDAIERSAFLRGENDRGWRADLDFFLQPKSFAKLIEGAYDH